MAVFIIDPFGCVRAYSEALTSHLREYVPAKLLTTGMTQVRGPIDRGDKTVERFFLRRTTLFKERHPWMPIPILKALGLVEYCVDLFRLRALRGPESIFHWQWIPVRALTVPFLLLFRVPIDVLTCHDLIPSRQANRNKLNLISSLPLRLAKKVIFHSPKLEAEALALAPFLVGKAQVIPHGLFFENAAPPRAVHQQCIFGVVGLLKNYKGLEGLCEAWTLAFPRMAAQGITLRIVGDCRMPSKARQSLVEKFASTPGLQWHFGYLSEDAFVAELAGLDLLVLPYSHCSQSGVALAAFGLGVPLLVSDAGALPELLEGGQERWIFKSGDIQALAEKLMDFADASAEQIEDYRRWIRARAQSYGKEVVVRAHLDVYEWRLFQPLPATLLEEAQ